MAEINLYYHTGSANHGCEAIVRGTHEILKQDLNLFSFSPEDEIKYKLNEIVEVYPDTGSPINSKTFRYFLAALQVKFFKKTLKMTKLKKRNFFSKIEKGDICLSIGGDNYTYQGVWELADYNKILHQKGAKTILWGCSIDVKLIPNLIDDLNRYDMIIARETLTYNALKRNQIKAELRLSPDPAFQLKKNEVRLPTHFKKNNTVGINLSPLILKYGNSDLIIKNFENLIDYIILETDFQIALIPHVFVPGNNDQEIMFPFYKKYMDTERILLIEDQNCSDLKGVISHCKFFMGARTHATIAAYSTEVPTIAIGYSMKAKGIATDIFGTFENYVCPVQQLTTDTELITAFKWLQRNESVIKEHYKNRMAEYKKRALEAALFLKELQ